LSRSLQPLVISLSLALGLAVTQGLGVMALPLILPAMMADLGWSYTQAGLLASAAAAGQLLGLLLTGVVRAAIAPARLFQLGLVVAAAALIATGSVRDIQQLTALRFVMGVATAPILVCGALLAASIYAYEPDRGRRVVSIFHAGTGAGLVAGGAVLPLMLTAMGARSWPEAWLTIGLVALVSLPFVVWACRRIVILPVRPSPSTVSWVCFGAALAATALFAGSLYVILTFLSLRALQQGANVFAIVSLWTTLGLAGVLSRTFWEPLLAHLTAGQRIAAPMGLAALGALLVLIEGASWMLVIAAALIGFGAFMVLQSITHLVHAVLPREDWAGTTSVFLMVIAASQTAGALAAGYWADVAGSLQPPLAVAAAGLGVAGLLALLQTRPASRPSALESPGMQQL
jgi:MFS family permease